MKTIQLDWFLSPKQLMLAIAQLKIPAESKPCKFSSPKVIQTIDFSKPSITSIEKMTIIRRYGENNKPIKDTSLNIYHP